eukprot:80844_1
MSLEMEVTAIYTGWLIEWSISIILCVLLLASTIYHFRKLAISQEHTIFLSVKIASISYFCAYIIAFALIISELCLKLTSNEDGSTDHVEDIVWGIGMLIGGFAELVFYLLLIMRLHSTFKDTVYRSSKYLYYAYILGIIVYAVCGIGYVGSVTVDANKLIRVVFIVIVSAINLLIRFSLIALFISKLCQLVAETSGAYNDMSQTITKHLLLGSFAIVCNTIALAVIGIERVTRDVDELGQKYGTFMYIGIALLGISVWIEMSCAYLGFSFNNTIYFAFCGKCHQRCCRPIAQRELRRMSMHAQSRQTKEQVGQTV